MTDWRQGKIQVTAGYGAENLHQYGEDKLHLMSRLNQAWVTVVFTDMANSVGI